MTIKQGYITSFREAMFQFTLWINLQVKNKWPKTYLIILGCLGYTQ